MIGTLFHKFNNLFAESIIIESQIFHKIEVISFLHFHQFNILDSIFLQFVMILLSLMFEDRTVVFTIHNQMFDMGGC